MKALAWYHLDNEKMAKLNLEIAARKGFIPAKDLVLTYNPFFS